MNKRTKSTIVIIIVILALFLGISIMMTKNIGPFKVSDNTTTTNPEDEVDGLPRSNLVVKVYYVDTKSSEYKTTCGVTRSVSREVLFTERVADTTLKALFAGPTAEEKATGLMSPFEANANVQPGTKNLGSYYNSVSITNGVARVDFKSEALQYLNSPACMQESVKKPIEDTLKQFPTITSVEYSINGEVYTEWDA